MPRKGRRARSMRGAVVDFDLMEIKRQMANQPKSLEVKAREDFIEQRLRRRAKRRAERTVVQTGTVDVDAQVENASEQDEPIVEKKLPPRTIKTPAEPDSFTKEEAQAAVKKVVKKAVSEEQPKPKARRIIKKKTEDK